MNNLYGLYLEFQKKVFKQLSELKLTMVELLEKRSKGPTSTNELLPKQAETMEVFHEFDITLKDDKHYRSTVFLVLLLLCWHCEFQALKVKLCKCDTLSNVKA